MRRDNEKNYILKNITKELTQESMPSRNSIKKNKTAQRLGNGNIAIASGYVTKARPGPLVATVATDIPVFSDMKPSTENTTKPANMLVPQFRIGITIESLKTIIIKTQ